MGKIALLLLILLGVAPVQANESFLRKMCGVNPDANCKTSFFNGFAQNLFANSRQAKASLQAQARKAMQGVPPQAPPFDQNCFQVAPGALAAVQYFDAQQALKIPDPRDNIAISNGSWSTVISQSRSREQKFQLDLKEIYQGTRVQPNQPARLGCQSTCTNARLRAKNKALADKIGEFERVCQTVQQNIVSNTVGQLEYAQKLLKDINSQSLLPTEKVRGNP